MSFIKKKVKICEKKSGKNKMSVFSYLPHINYIFDTNLCNHILVNSVIWLLTKRHIREREREERRLKYIELFKGLPAVHHCHLTHVQCEVPSQQPLGGHLLPHTHTVQTWVYTHTHMHIGVAPQISMFKEKEKN